MRYREEWRAREGGHSDLARLEIGSIIVYDRKPWRLEYLREVPWEKWPAQFVEAYERSRMPHSSWNTLTAPPPVIAAEWHYRPMQVGLKPDREKDGTTTIALIGPRAYLWETLPEHYSVCVRCDEIPPCTHTHNETVAAINTRAFNHAMSIMPGACLGCHEVITERQKTITFTGANLIRPDFGDDSAIFHARHSCRSHVEDYDRRWATATGKPRRFFCEGTISHHFEDAAPPECDKEDECPGTEARHRTTVWHSRTANGERNSACWCCAG